MLINLLKSHLTGIPSSAITSAPAVKQSGTIVATKYKYSKKNVFKKDPH